MTYNGYRTEWRQIWSVITQVSTELDDHEEGVWVVIHEYDHRPLSDDTTSHYQLIISITISEDYCQGCEWFAFSANLLLAQPMYKCQITCKFPINDQSWGILTNQICENWNIILWLIVELSGEQASSILASLPTYLLKHLRPFLRCFHGYWFYSPLGVGIHDQHHDYRINDYGINQ